MDDRRFDAIARSLGTSRSRRGALGLLAGAAGLGLAGADAKRRKGKGKGKHGRGGKAHLAEQSAVCAAAGSRTCTLAQAKPGAILSNCNYAGASLYTHALNAANLTKASLADADLSGANLAGANLSRACLAGADLTLASLRGTNLTKVDLTGADLRGANLRGSNVKPAQLATATVDCGTTLPNNKPGGCPTGATCESGACVCPPCQSPIDGACAPDPALDHACGGSCPSGQWCDAGACADVASTVRVTDVGSRCSHGGTPQPATVCGVAVTAPDCSLCPAQAGCSSNEITDGPAGTSWYCSQSGYPECTTNADCAADPSKPWCGREVAGSETCTTICPY